MGFKLRKIHHLIRYFILIGIAVFIAFLKHWYDDVVLYLIGPTLYLAHFIREAFRMAIPGIPYEIDVNYYGFLLPVTVVYFGLLGTLSKILWNEHGAMRMPTFVAFMGFTMFIHYFTGKILLGYFEIYP